MLNHIIFLHRKTSNITNEEVGVEKMFKPQSDLVNYFC